jgi:hypothetical protein
VVVVLVLLFAVPIVLGLAGLGATAAFKGSCSLASLRPVSIGENSFVYAVDGSLLGTIPAERNRQPVPLSQIGPWMARATIATEDRRFYQHGGVDRGIPAAWRDVNQGRVVEGGSTITQQVVRNPTSRVSGPSTQDGRPAWRSSSTGTGRGPDPRDLMNQCTSATAPTASGAASVLPKHASRLTLMSRAAGWAPTGASLYDPILHRGGPSRRGGC